MSCSRLADARVSLKSSSLSVPDFDLRPLLVFVIIGLGNVNKSLKSIFLEETGQGQVLGTRWHSYANVTVF